MILLFHSSILGCEELVRTGLSPSSSRAGSSSSYPPLICIRTSPPARGHTHAYRLYRRLLISNLIIDLQTIAFVVFECPFSAELDPG